MEFVITLLRAGWETLLEYLSFHVLTCLVPAFFIAGAIQVFLSKDAVLKYLGPRSNKFLAYAVASVSGTVLAVCSCTVLPMFAGIHRRGAGIGPASAFLYAGPAINILAIVYTARLLGMDIGIARAVGAISFSIIIGIAMALIFGRHEKRTGEGFATVAAEPKSDRGEIGKRALLFLSLGGLLVFGAAKQWIPAGIFLGFSALIPLFLLPKRENLDWLRETWLFSKQIFPWLIVGVFCAGIIKVVLPQHWVAASVGQNTIPANAFAAVFGAVMYFSTLMEVPVLRAFMDMGMAKGPALTYLLADPALSLPGILALRAILGTKRTLVFVGLVVVFSTIAGYLLGMVI